MGSRGFLRITRRAITRWGTLGVACLACLAGFAVGEAPAAAAPKPILPPARVLNVQIPSDLATLDWQQSTRRLETFLIRNVHRGLFRADARNRLISDLADGYEVLDKGRKLRVWLKSDVKWSDGEPLTAEHWVSSFRRLLSPALSSPAASIFDEVVGAVAFKEGRESDFSKVGIRIIEQKKRKALEFQLTRSHPMWVSRLMAPATFPVRTDLIEKLGSQWVFPGKWVVLGPWVLKSREAGVSYTLERNPYFSQVKATTSQKNIDRVNVRIIPDDQLSEAVAAGKVDLVCHFGFQSRKEARLLSQWKRGRTIDVPALGTKRIEFNTQGFRTSDERFRKSLVLALDRPALAREILGAKVAYSLAPTGWEGFRPQTALGTNTVQAKSIFTRATAFDAGSVDLIVPLFDENTEENQKVAELLRSRWEKTLGLTVNVKGLSTPEAYTMARDTLSYGLILRDWHADYPDSESIYGGYSDLSLSIGQRLRSRQFVLLDRELVDDKAAVIPLFTRTDASWISASWSGFSPQPWDRCPWSEIQSVK